MTTTVAQREKMAYQLMMRGHATIDEILTANFGEWPPKGLDIIGYNNQRVNIVPLMDHSNGDNPLSRMWNKVKDMWSVAGRGSLGGERNLYLNRFMCCMVPSWLGGGGLNSTMGHEATHNLQGDHYWRAESIFRREDVRKIWEQQSDALSNLIADKVYDEHMDRSRLRTVFNKVAKYVYTDIEYQREGIELQARLHETMMNGYPAWGRMPANRQELLSAMEDAGLKMPVSVREQLDAMPGIEETRATFKGARKNGGLPTGLSFAVNALTDKGREEFWNRGLPALYSDLIEMYGDGPGRARFNFGVNERAAYRMQSQLLMQPPSQTARAEA